MAHRTLNFGFAYYDLGDDLADLANAQIDMERFVILDQQLYGLYSIFGSGTVSGWQVTTDTQSQNGISVIVTAGLGIINLYAVETLFDTSVDNLPPNLTLYIYAQTTGLTPMDRSANFFFQRTLGSNNAILLARVTTGDFGVVSIDNTVRRQVGFQAAIDTSIATHHHRGSPTKIDLANETQGQLPGNKIGSLSATQVTTGVFDPARIPAISHTSLKDIGEFSHIAIDAMLRKITPLPTDQLMGDIALVNQLRGDIYDKYSFPDKDHDLVNELIMIAGISPDSFVDWAACTANVNTVSNCICGIPVSTGTSMNVLWNNQTAFGNAPTQTGVTIDSLGVTIQRADLVTYLVEGFNDGADGDLLSSFVSSLEAIDNSTGVFADATNEIEPPNAGMFHVEQRVRAVFTKTFTTPQDWTNFDRLSIFVKCDDLTHGPAYLYYTTSTGFQSDPLLLLDLNEVTTNLDPSLKGFEERVMLLTAERGDVISVVVFAEDVQNDYSFWLDNIRLKKSQNYLAQGSIRLRYSTGANVVFNSLAYTTTLPTGTQVKARIRVADSEGDLDAALFSGFISPTATFSLQGKAAEVEIDLYSDIAQSVTPLVTEVELSLTTNAGTNGIVVDTYDQFAAGTFSNLSLANTLPDATVSITPPVAVNNILYLNHQIVGEVNSSKLPVFSINGSNLPVSEIQAFAQYFGSPKYGLTNPRSVVRTSGRQYIVCDTDNHRILTFDGSGALVSAYCGFNSDVDTSATDVLALTATYNPTTGILYLGFSKTLTGHYTDLAKVTVTVGAKLVTLADEGTALAVSTGNSAMFGRVLSIPLTTDHQSMLNGNTDTANVTFTLDFVPGFNQTYASKKIRLYSAPVTYYQFIYYPVYAAPSAAGNLWICNATKLDFVVNSAGQTVEPITPETRNLQEYSPSVELNRHTNNVFYSKHFGGSVLETAAGDLISCGLSDGRVGQVVLNPITNLNVIYTSPTNNQPTQCGMDSEGYLWVAESSGTVRAGRIVRIDLDGNLISKIDGVYTVINSIQILENDDLLVST